MLNDFSTIQIFLTGLIFIWTGFVRSGLGFGGGALGIPLMLLVYPEPLFWLPVIGTHLLFFSGLTLRTRLNDVNWAYLRHSATFIVPAALIGVFGLLNLPTDWVLIFIYGVTLFYAVIWVMDLAIESHSNWVDRSLLLLGGYVAGTSLTGAPLMVAVFMRNVSREQLRNTLFVLWFTLVTIKMSAFAVLSVDLQTLTALALLPVAAIGHLIGLKTHDAIIKNDQQFKRWIGAGLILVSLLGLWKLFV
ncbi:MAG: TSUP family transporter [Pseudomonadota bacterium]